MLRSLGLFQGGTAVVIGCGLVSLFAGLCMRLAARDSLSTYEMSRRSFGFFGSKFVSLLIAITLMGWFSITGTLFGTAAPLISEFTGINVNGSTVIVLGGIFVTLTVIYGFRSIELFSRFATPVLLLILLSGIVAVLSNYGWPSLRQSEPLLSPGLSTIGAGISLVIGAFMVAVAISPDIARFANSAAAGQRAALLGYGVGGAVVLVSAGLPGLATSSNDLVQGFSAVGMGLAALILLPLALWTTNAGNLYSANLALSEVMPKIPPKFSCVLLGIIGTGLALTFNFGAFTTFLQLLAIAIPPIAGIYLCDGYLFESLISEREPLRFDYGALIAWFMAASIACLATWGPLSFLSIPALASLICAFCIRYCLNKLLTTKIL